MSRPTLTFMEADNCLKTDLLSLSQQAVMYVKIYKVGHYTRNALGPLSFHRFPHVALVTDVPALQAPATTGTQTGGLAPIDAEGPAAAPPGAALEAPEGTVYDCPALGGTPLLSAATDNLAQLARKLHIQCSHASADRLRALLLAQAVRDAAVFSTIRATVNGCAVGRKNGPAPTHAVVTMPRSSPFNELVALDLFFLPGSPPIAVLHAIDAHSRF